MCMYVCVVYVYVCIYVCMCMYVCVVYAYVCIHVCMCMYVCVVYVYVCIYVCMCMYVCVVYVYVRPPSSKVVVVANSSGCIGSCVCVGVVCGR